MENNLIGDQFFTKNPDKILGEMSISNYMNQIIIKGDKEKVKDFFKVQPVPEIKIDPIIEELEPTVDQNVIEEVIIPKKQRKSKIVTETLPIHIKEHHVLSIEDNIKKYTPHLTDQDIMGFVWYNRTLGIPMTGWEKWFIKSTKKELAIAKEEVEYLNNKWQSIGVFLKGQEVGKPTRFEHSYNGIKYVSVRGLDGQILLVDKDKLKIPSDLYDKEELNKLVKAKSLFYLNGSYVPLHIYTNTDYQILRESLNSDKNYILENFGQDALDYHEEFLKSYLSFRIDEPNRDKRFKLNPFGEIAREFQLEYKGTETNLSDAFESYCHTLNQSAFETVSKQEFTSIILYKRDRADRGSSDEDKEKKKVDVNSAYIEAERLFSDFLFSELEREYQVRLNVIINETYNRSLVVRNDKIPVGFSCSSLFGQKEFSLKPVQVEAFKYAVARNSFCLALSVGFGKLSLGISLLAYLVQSGTAKRPIAVVPKPILKQWMREMNGYWADDKNNISFVEREGMQQFFGILSGTGIQVNFLSNLNKKYQTVLKNNPIQDNTITLVSYEALEKIYIQDADERMHVINTWKTILKQSVEGKKESERSESKKMLSLIESLNKVDKDAVIPIDDTKIDFIMVDEAHRLKNMFVGVEADKSSRIKSGFKGSSSNRALRAFYLSQYMHKNYKGRMGFLTATPFSNSPLEVFTMLCFLGYGELVKNNVYKIQNFVEQFFNETFEYVVDSKNQIVAQSVMKKYKNKRILYKLLTNVFLYKNDPKLAGISRPCIIRYPNKDQKIILKMSDLQMMQRGTLSQDKKIQTYIDSRVEGDDLLERYYEEFKDRMQDMETGKSDIGLAGSILACSKISALSPFASSPVSMRFISDRPWQELYDYSPKIKFTVDAIKSMLEYQISRNEKPSSFVIYSSLGNNILPYIKEALENIVGFKKNILKESDDDDGVFNVDEVEIIEGSADSDKEINRRELIQAQFNIGKVKVIIGTSTIKEGLNLQGNSSTLFNLTPDWNSTDVEQIEGRIHRQGNRYGYVRIITPLVIGTLDSFIYQKYEEKKSRLKDIWEDDGQMVTEDMNVEISPEKQKELILSDEDQIAKIRFGFIKRNLDNQMNKINDDIDLLVSSANTIKSYNKYLSAATDQLDQLQETIVSNIEALNFLLSEPKLPSYINKERVKTVLEYYAEFKQDIDQACISREAKDIVNILSPSFMRRSLSLNIRFYDDQVAFEKMMNANGYKNHQNLINDEIAIYPHAISLQYVDYYNKDKTSNFAELKQVFNTARLVERELLIPNGLTLTSPVDKLKDIEHTYRMKKAEAEKYYSTIFDERGKPEEEYYKEVTSEIKQGLDQENKMALNPDQMVREFCAKTNGQLSLLKEDVDTDDCEMPEVLEFETPEVENVEYIDEKYTKLYKSLKLVLPDIDRMPVGFHARSGKYGDAIMPLSVELQYLPDSQDILNVEGGGHKLIMEHNYIQEGDLITDPRIDFAIYPSIKAAVPLNFEMNIMGVYQEFVENKKIIDAKRMNESIKFTTQWCINLVEQGRTISMLSVKIKMLKVILEQKFEKGGKLDSGILVYHGGNITGSLDIRKGDFGINFGTKEQAGARLTMKEKGNIKPYFIHPKKTLELHFDMGWWNDHNKWQDLGYIPENYNGDIIDYLNKQGYDTIVYPNEVEGDGLSYIVLDSSIIEPHK